MKTFFESEDLQDMVRKSGLKLSVGFDGHRVEEYLPERVRIACKRLKIMGIQLAQEFLELRTEQPQIFYIWGHSYEFDAFDSWDWFDEFCALISGRDDIFYGTNGEVFKRYRLI